MNKTEFIGLLDAIAGNRTNTVQLNKNEGTVTMDYKAYYLLRHDSLMLALLMLCPEEKESLEILESYNESGIVGHGFEFSHSPMTDMDAICYCYGVTEESIKTYFEEVSNA